MIRLLCRALPLVAAAGLPLAAPSYSFASTTLKPLTLQQSDVPHNCKLLSGQVISNAYVEASRRITAAQLAAFGRITGFASTYVCTGTKGIQSVASEAVQFKSASGAQRYYQMIVAGDLAQVGRLGSFRRLATGGVGNAVTGFSYEAKALHANLQLKVYGIEIFRRGHYLATVQATGPVGTWNTTLVTSLSRVIDGRMKTAR